MNLNIQAILASMLSILKTAYGVLIPSLEQEGISYVTEAEPRLLELAQNRISGVITNSQFLEQLGKEPAILKLELIGLAEQAGVQIEDTVDTIVAGAINVFSAAVNGNIDTVLQGAAATNTAKQEAATNQDENKVTGTAPALETAGGTEAEPEAHDLAETEIASFQEPVNDAPKTQGNSAPESPSIGGGDVKAQFGI